MPRVVPIALLVVAALAASTLRASSATPKSARSAPAVEFGPALFKNLAWRSIGPANMGGRITDFAVVEKSPATFLMATATGGAFKTTNRGTTWQAVFDTQAVASVGAVALWQKNPAIAWIGTGEANSRNSSSWGRGVYRSDDGGASWKLAGLEATSAIARIVCDPADSNTVYVAALGRLWGANRERGVFVTRDGGRSWQHTLAVDANTGAVDLVMDPSDARTLYAAMYARRRTPWSYSGVSATGGIWKSVDAGRTWRKLTNGLPKRTGRIGLDVFRRNPRVLYAVVESDEGGRLAEFEDTSRSGGVFRSDDAGETWSRISAFTPRPFYFSTIRVQPDDSTRVYLGGMDLFVSDDGGVTFRSRGARNLHPDIHAMWVDPADGAHILLGTDGGMYQSYDRAQNWDYVDNLPLGQFYNITTDSRDPYHVYGGLQDNQSWGGPSRTRLEVESWLDDPSGKGISNDHWYLLGGGDGFHVQVDPLDPDIVYYESQSGYLVRQHLGSGAERNLRPSNAEGEPVFRFNWNTPFQISPHDPTVLWMGGNHVFRLTSRGDRWELASPDLTTRDPAKMATGGSGAEAHCTITALAESPVRAGTVWAGTDDGRIWVTSNGGAAWVDVTRNLRVAPAGLYVSRVEPSHHDARTAYVSIDGHRSDVFTPFVFVTRDLGQTWTSIASDLPKDGPVKVIREDLQNPRLLFAGTEFGFFLSIDGGGHWHAFKEGLPTVAVDDIQVQPRERDLVIGTHGRSVFVLDGIQALEQWTERTLIDTVTFFAPRPATAYYKRPLGAFWGQRAFAAKNPPQGAWLDYMVPREISGGVKLTISDSTGRVVRTLEGPGAAGFQRVVWDLVAGDPKTRIGRVEWGGQPRYVRPGRYRVRLTAGSASPQDRTLEVRAPVGTYSDEL